jgi:hypothetical protein
MKRQSNRNTLSLHISPRCHQVNAKNRIKNRMEGSVNLQTNEHLVAYLRELRAQGKIAISDSHLAAVRESKMTRHDVKRRQYRQRTGSKRHQAGRISQRSRNYRVGAAHCNPGTTRRART